jgi:hypothetical protein
MKICMLAVPCRLKMNMIPVFKQTSKRRTKAGAENHAGPMAVKSPAPGVRLQQGRAAAGPAGKPGGTALSCRLVWWWGIPAAGIRRGMYNAFHQVGGFQPWVSFMVKTEHHGFTRG